MTARKQATTRRVTIRKRRATLKPYRRELERAAVPPSVIFQPHDIPKRRGQAMWKIFKKCVDDMTEQELQFVVDYPERWARL
jgi:hypothetical protein